MKAAAVEDDEENIYDIYREALAVQERKGVLAAGGGWCSGGPASFRRDAGSVQ